jgi:hypothetical protein
VIRRRPLAHAHGQGRQAGGAGAADPTGSVAVTRRAKRIGRRAKSRPQPFEAQLEIWLPGVDETEKYEFAIPLRQNEPPVPKSRKRDRDRAKALLSLAMCDEGLLAKVGYGRYRAADLKAA